MKKDKKHVAYILVSVACLILHNIILILMDAAGYSLLSAIFFSFILVVTMGYIAHSRFTFRKPLSWARLKRYILAMSVNLITAFAVTWFYKSACHLPMTIAAPLTSISMLLINFFLSRWAIITTPEPTGATP